jgi:hypothetical protein
MYLEILVSIAVALTIVFIVFYFTTAQTSYIGSEELFNLSIPNTKLSDNKACPWSNEASSMRFAVFIQSAPRTVQKVDCIDNNQSLAPSCSDYSFKRCECSGIDCNRCSLNNSYLSKIISVGDSLELWASGYTSQNDKPYIPALLKIKTSKGSSSYSIETISLPAIPLQKWTVITIVKEGRRFDIYYDKKPVASQLLSYVPVSPDSSRMWYGGASGWAGKIGLFACASRAYSKFDVEDDVDSIVDSRGIPYITRKLKFDVKDIKVPKCIFGNCNALPEIKPPNSFYTFQSNMN